MKDINKMRLDIIQQLKFVRKFFDHLEKGVKERRPEAIFPAYVFLRCLTYHMNEGDLTPDSIELAQAILNKEYENEGIMKNNK